MILRPDTPHQPLSGYRGEARIRVMTSTATRLDSVAEARPCRVPAPGLGWLDAHIADRYAALERMLSEQWCQLAPDEYDHALPGPGQSADPVAQRSLPGQGGVHDRR